MTLVSPPIVAELDLPSVEGQWSKVRRRFRRHRMAMISLAVLVTVFMASVLAPWITPFPSNNIVVDRAFTRPFSTAASTDTFHLLGTDDLGRDYFTRLLYAARVSLTVAFTVTTTSSLIGITLGLLAGYFGGWVDTSISRLLEFVATFPGQTILLILSSLALRNEDLVRVPDLFTVPLGIIMAISPREANQVALLVLVLSLLGWMGTTRLTRGAVLALRENAYIESSRALGASSLRVILRHVLPNALPPLIVDFTLGLNGALVAEAALSFLGFGIQDPTPTWGNMLGVAREHMFNRPWMTLVTGMPILIVALAINYVGDGLRDALDPRTRL